MTLSTPVKIVALAALALALGLAGAVLMLAGHSAAASAPPVVQHTTPMVAHKTVKPHKPKVVLDPSLPLNVRRALLRDAVAVIAVYNSRTAGDHAVLAAARTGARQAHAAFAAADVSREGVAEGVATWSSNVVDPGVIVVRRPGKIVFAVTGPTDEQTIAQAALTAR
jgi:hypothetical protein